MSLNGDRRRYWFWIAGVLMLLGLGLGVLCLYSRKDAGQPYDPPKNPFDGSSDSLQQTVVVATLETPIPENKSAIWCSSFQMAWNHLKTDIAQGPIQLKNADALADRLNKAESSESDLDAQDFYAAAGTVKEGVIQRIQADMGHKFPDFPTPAFDVPPDGAVAYGYLRAQVKFKIPFFDNDREFTFTDSAGKKVPVKSFGIRGKDEYAYWKLRKQVHVLYHPDDSEFIVDPCKHSHPYQIILARTARKATLAEAVADVHKKIADRPTDEFDSKVGPNDCLLIPNMNWRVTHRFTELEGVDKAFLNPALKGLYLGTALQTIQFRLDRSGAELASEAKVLMLPIPSLFYFDQPFLILLKKRDAKQPFFVMWVDNGELLDR